MAGTFLKGQEKIIPGEYHRYITDDIQTAGVINGVGAGIIKADWGPLGEAVHITDIREADVFGTGQTADLIAEMFAGGIVEGYFVRIGTGGAAPGITIQDDTAADRLKINGAYAGERNFTASIRDKLDGNGRELIIYDGTQVYLTVGFPSGGNEGASLKEALEAKTKEFTVEDIDLSTDHVLETLTQGALTGGVNPTATVASYGDGLDSLESTDFNVLCVDTEDKDVHMLAAAFLERAYDTGAFPMACFARTMAMDIDLRMAYAAAFDSAMITFCLNPGIDGKTGDIIDGYHLAARIGGLIAAVPSNTSITHTEVPGISDIAETLAPSVVEKALLNGCLVLTKSKAGKPWITQGINTLQNLSDEQDSGWKKIRRVKTRFELMQRIQTSHDDLIGKVDNDKNGRATLIAAAQGVINDMIAESKLTAGAIVESAIYKATGASAWFDIAVIDKDSVEYIYNTYIFNFDTV